MLPNADRAVVDPEKVHGYLLSATHPVGRFKAVFFRSVGFSVDRWELLRDALLQHGRDGLYEQGEVRISEHRDHADRSIVIAQIGPS